MINGNTPRPRSPWSCQRVARNRAPVCPLSALPSAAETSLRSPVCRRFRSLDPQQQRLAITTFRPLISHHRNKIRFFIPLLNFSPLSPFSTLFHTFSMKNHWFVQPSTKVSYPHRRCFMRGMEIKKIVQHQRRSCSLHNERFLKVSDGTK